MADTPEAKVKKLVKRVLSDFQDAYVFWPVPYGIGESSLDCIVFQHGFAIGIETKAPGKKPTPRQLQIIERMERAGARVFVIDGPEGAQQLREYMDELHRKCKTLGSGSPSAP